MKGGNDLAKQIMALTVALTVTTPSSRENNRIPTNNERTPKMKTPFVRAGVFALTLVVSTATLFAQVKKPNILVIFGDDVGQTNISAYSMGVVGYHTPNI